MEESVKDLLPGSDDLNAHAPQALLVFQFGNHSWEYGIRILWIFRRLREQFSCGWKTLSG